MECAICGLGDCVELGGGPNPHHHIDNLTAVPIFRPNIDIMCHPNVNIIHDLETGIPLHDAHATELRAIHLIMSFSWKSVPFFLRECLRVLKPGGHIFLMIPDMEWVFAQVLKEGLTSGHLQSIWGEQDYPSDFHRCGFTFATLSAALSEAGFVNIKHAGKRNPWELSVEAWKP